MNVIFLDFEGVLDTYGDTVLELYYGVPKEVIRKKVERRIAILGDICKEYDCKVVIEAAAKCNIDDETLEIIEPSERLEFYFAMFKKYGIEVIGKTPDGEIKEVRESSTLIHSMNKQIEIMLYLYRHPEIDYFCVIDDDDEASIYHRKSDLEKVKNHLVRTLDFQDNPDEEGLLERHKELVGRALQVENEVKRLIKRRENKKRID